LGQAIPLVWVAGGMARVGLRDGPGATRSAEVSAGRGEYEAFQVVVQGAKGGLTNVNVTASDLVGPSGQRIAASNLSLFRERYIEIPRPSQSRGRRNPSLGAGTYPDGLVPFKTASGANASAAPFAVAEGENQPIWVDVYVPRGTVAGAYVGTLAVTSDQGRASVPVRLTVWDFELPLRPSLRSSFGVWMPHSVDKRFHELLLDHKVAPHVINNEDAPDLMSLRGLGATGLRFWPSNSGCSMDPAPSVAALQSAAASYPSDLEVYVYVADEITRYSCLFPTVKQWARNIHQTRAKSLVTVAPLDELLDDGTGRSAVDTWVVLPKLWDSTTSAFQKARARGDSIWWYTCLAQDDYSPKWLIDYAPMNFRVGTGFISQSLDVTGILYWRVENWSEDPWSVPADFPSDGKSNFGDGMLVYPGEPVGVSGPVPSMRLKWIREGVEDYEYVEMLKNLGRGDFAIGVARSVGADWGNWTKDPAALAAARTQLGEELHRLHGKPAIP
jgi:hypothetical protein